MSSGIRHRIGLAHHQLDICQFSQCFEHGECNAKGDAGIATLEPGQGLPVDTASAFEFGERALLQLACGTDPLAQAAEDVQYCA